MRWIEDQTRIDDRDCIKFVPRTNQANWLRIHSGTGPLSGCWSYVGRLTRPGAQDLSLEKRGTGTGHCISPGVSAHELMHALGFNHEQQRSDRDGFVRIRYENMRPDFYSQFDKLSPSVQDNLGMGYDILSMMHYDNYAASNNGQPTIEALDGTPLIHSAYKNALSPQDVAEIRKLYGCN